jgi:hypothetical protein
MAKPQQKHDPSKQEEQRRADHQGQEQLQGYNGSSFYDPTAGFSMDAKLIGGELKINDPQMAGSVGLGAGVVSDADAALTKSALTQTITMGANIQFNSATIRASGHDLTDHHHTV